MQKRFLIIIGIIVLVAIIFGGVFYVMHNANQLTNQNPVSCVPEGGNYHAPASISDLCCSGLVQQPTSESGTTGICVKPTDQTTGWKTYTNKQYGFELKYPKDWIVEENIMSLEHSLIFCLNKNNSCVGKKYDKKFEDENGPIYLFTYKKDPDPNDPAYKDLYLKINGNPSFHFIGLNKSEDSNYYLLSEFPKNKTVLDYMISTFKFIK